MPLSFRRLATVSTLALPLTFAQISFAKTSSQVLEGNLPAPVKSAIRDLINEKAVSADSQWTTDAIEKLSTLPETDAALKESVLKTRAESELSTSEVKSMLKIEDDNVSKEPKDATDFESRIKADGKATQGRRSRPTQTPSGAFYVDVYQESPVLLDYNGNTQNSVKNMSFEVVTKYTANGPHFVRAHLVSTGSAGHRSVVGEFDIDRRHRYYVSHTYGSRMDYAQFFIGGIALHQTPVSNYRILGGPASHGCIRHHEWDADAMWNLIGNEGSSRNINIKVHAFGEKVTLADGSMADGSVASDMQGNRFGKKLNEWINRSIYCTRHDRDVSTPDTDYCTKTWDRW